MTESFTQKPDSTSWNIIWQLDPEQSRLCIERDWFNMLFADVPVSAVHIDYRDKPMLGQVSPRAIVCASCPNLTAADELAEYLQKLPRPRVLYHMSDEHLKVGAELYRHCDLVIRNGSALFDRAAGLPVVQLPLGYGVGFEGTGDFGINAAERAFQWSFLGFMRRERRTEMLPAMQTVPGKHFLRETQSWSDALKRFGDSSSSIYQQTVFVPCPKGKWNSECNREYDALEWGCIPLLRNYTESPYHDGYYKKLLGDHPLPEYDTWAEAADFAARMLRQPDKLNALQVTVFDWWQSYKKQLKNDINVALQKL